MAKQQIPQTQSLTALVLKRGAVGVHLDQAAGLAFVHQGDGVHQYDPNAAGDCDRCTPVVESITGGNDGSESPLPSADLERPGEGIGAACDIGECPFVAAGPNEDDARTLLAGHIRAEHPEVGEDDGHLVTE